MGLVLPLAIWTPEAEAAPVVASPAGSLMERLAESATSADSVAQQTEPAGEADLDPAYIQPDPQALAEAAAEPAAEPAPEMPPAIVAPPLSAEQVAINAEMAYQQKLEDAEQEFMEASLEVNRIENEIVGLKAELKSARELADAFALRLRSIRNKSDAADDDEDDDGDDDCTELYAQPAGPENPLLEDADNSAWRTAPLRPIIEGTKGCGAKKLDSICDLCPTVGDLVDLQVKAGASGVNTLMPDGVGRKLCDAIEEKVLDFITAQQGGDFSKTLAEGSANLEARREEFAGDMEDQQDDAAGDDADAVGNQDDEPIADPQAEDDLALDPVLAAQLRTRIATLKRRESKEPTVQACYESGRAAARNECRFTECTWMAGPEQDSWLLGWLSIPQAN